jgi:hypothetical protein
MPTPESLEQRVARVVESTPVHDIHTHLYDPGFRSLLAWGIDEQLVYHYLVSESFRQLDVPFERFWSASRSEQAEFVWKALFVDHSPVSESCRGVLTTLHALGLDPRQQDLSALRAWFAEQKPEDFVDRVLKLANVQSVCMTNSPFDDEERAYWEARPVRDSRFQAALRIDPLLLSWPESAARLRGWGYAVGLESSPGTVSEVRRFLADWTLRLKSRYCMVSLPPTFVFPSANDTYWLIEQAVLPHCREFDQPFALMMGVKRAVNPLLRMAGDGVGRSDLTALQNLCASHPENRFLVTCLARENQHELVVLARKFRNLHPFGCWWFTNTPQLIEEITTMRLELLGTSFTPQHSDARVIDQLIYKWRHTRAILTRCLTQKYAAIAASGWAVTNAELQRDVTELLGGSFQKFCGPGPQ